MSVRKYFKFDEINQFLTDEADINYFTTNQARRVAVGNMLGDFDENGFYVLDKKIAKQLVAMPKIIVDSVEGADLIRSAIKFDAFLHFMVTFDEDRARLILLEKINFESNVTYNAGSYANMNEYVLDEIQIPDRDVDKTVVYTKFNILREDQGKVYDINALTLQEQLNFDAIINKMKYNYLAQNELLTSETAIEKMEADYFDNVLNSFDDFPKEKQAFKLMLKKAILEKINFLQISKPFFQKTINEILDNCLRVIVMKLTPAQREEIEKKIRKVKEKYYQEYNKIVHLQFISSVNAQKEVSTDNMISEVISSNQTEVRVMKMSVDETKLDNSLSNIMAENTALKDKLTIKNSGEKTITAHNPELKQFFGEFKQEIGIDVLKSAPQTYEVKDQVEVKKPAPAIKAEPEVKKERVETPVEKKAEEQRVQPRREEKPREVASSLQPRKSNTDTTRARQNTDNSRSLISDYASDYSSGTTLDNQTAQPAQAEKVAETQGRQASASDKYVPTVDDDGMSVS